MGSCSLARQDDGDSLQGEIYDPLQDVVRGILQNDRDAVLFSDDAQVGVAQSARRQGNDAVAVLREDMFQNDGGFFSISIAGQKTSLQPLDRGAEVVLDCLVEIEERQSEAVGQQPAYSSFSYAADAGEKDSHRYPIFLVANASGAVLAQLSISIAYRGRGRFRPSQLDYSCHE